MQPGEVGRLAALADDDRGRPRPRASRRSRRCRRGAAGRDVRDAVGLQARLGIVEDRPAAALRQLRALLVEAGEIGEQGIARIDVQIAAEIRRRAGTSRRPSTCNTSTAAPERPAAQAA
jgi:hypothetical protein